LTIIDPEDSPLMDTDVYWWEKPKTYRLPEDTLNGTYTVRMEVNTGPYQGTLREEDFFGVGPPDETPPTGTVVINDDDTYTNSVHVELDLTYSDATSGVDKVRYSNDGVWDTEPWESPLDTKAWDLASGDGLKTVYYEVRDNALNTATFQDTIILDARALTVTSPNGGEGWVGGTTHTLTWASTGSPGAYVKIELLKAGVVKKVISSKAANTGSYSWVIPSTQALGADYKIRITSTTNKAITDSSDAYFAIIAEELTVTSPNGGEGWVGGTTHAVNWTSTGNPLAKVKIELVKAGVVKKVISSSAVNSGSFNWAIPATQALGADYRIRITSTTKPAGGSAATDSSDAFSVIAEVVVVTSPNGGESWIGGTTHAITWTSTGNPLAKVKIELLKAGVVKKVISSSAVNSCSFNWAIPATQALGADYSVRITSTTKPAGGSAATDSSDAFSVIP